MKVGKYIYLCSNQERADRVLFEVLDICKDLDIEVYVIFGTLLGFYRDGMYIFGDNDIDLFIKCEKDARERLKKRMIKQKFEIGCIGGAIASMNMHTVKDQIFVDIWIKMRTSLMKFYSGTKEIEYKGRKIPVPKDTEGYLEAAYGDWRTKMKKAANPFGK